MTNTENKVYECLKPIVEELGYKLYDVIYEKEAQTNYLRIIIDNDSGISINDCENVNNAITDILDEKDFIKNAYMLEVSSPGIERRLRSDEHLEQNIGQKIEIHTFSIIEKIKAKVITGILKQFNEKTISISINDEQTIDIERDNISKITTIYDWEGK